MHGRWGCCMLFYYAQLSAPRMPSTSFPTIAMFILLP